MDYYSFYCRLFRTEDIVIDVGDALYCHIIPPASAKEPQDAAVGEEERTERRALL